MQYHVLFSAHQNQEPTQWLYSCHQISYVPWPRSAESEAKVLYFSPILRYQVQVTHAVCLTEGQLVITIQTVP